MGEEKSCFTKTDVVNEEQVRVAVEAAATKFGTIHACINCAGIIPVVHTITSKTLMDLETFRETIEVNVYGNIHATRHAVKYMVKNTKVPSIGGTGERGVIINIASIAAFEGGRGNVAYSASKAALVGMTLPMARDLGRFGIRVVSISPGMFDTPMARSFGNGKMTMAEFAKHMLPKRYGTPAEFAHLAKTVIENSYLNGVDLKLDGGHVNSKI